MKKIIGLSILSGMFLFTSCIKHEVIPAPSPRVDLPASFRGSLQGSEYELIKDVDGYYCEATQAKEILPTPMPSKVIYYSAIHSAEKYDYIQIGLGKLSYNADNSIVPALENFTSFFENNMNPDFKHGADGGVEIIFRDALGNTWISDEDSPLPQSFEFLSINQESDEDGDYLKFKARFNVTLYDDLDDPQDAIIFENATFEGYFQR